ncbi:phosphotransferase, partial [Corynebacterium sp.]|uniref:phosphotransferase n=1 Tax=Corynebacterium sp. TaxID=1720 RepID=UPI0026E0AB2C
FHVADPAALQAVVARACADLRALPPGDLVPTHRDLHDKQLLWERNAGPGLLDVDTACLADPALDVANLRAHAVWRFRQGVWDDRQAAVVLGVLESNAAVKAYERATLVRLVCVYAVRPRYREAARALLAELA